MRLVLVFLAALIGFAALAGGGWLLARCMEWVMKRLKSRGTSEGAAYNAAMFIVLGLFFAGVVTAIVALGEKTK
jgi:hypothetical protein